MHTIDKTVHDNGIITTIEYDSDCESPFDGDDGIRIVVLHRRYSDPAKGACGSDPNEVMQWAKDNAKDWFVAPLWLYDHSGVAYRAGVANPFSCPWDSGQVGIIALKRSEWGSGKESDAKLLEYAKNAAETYGQWANGECYGYRVIKARRFEDGEICRDEDEGEEIDSCYGFIGYDGVEEALQEAYESAV